jgi:hypothetical protein
MIIKSIFIFKLDDPMLKYLSNKTADASDRTNNSNSAPAKPRYRGPDPQKNRYAYEFFNV